MGHDWVLDVLTDLKTFARANGLPTLAAQLEDTAFVAQAEIASQAKGNGIGLHGSGGCAGWADRKAGIRKGA